jgi:hypothetical protein
MLLLQNFLLLPSHKSYVLDLRFHALKPFETAGTQQDCWAADQLMPAAGIHSAHFSLLHRLPALLPGSCAATSLLMRNIIYKCIHGSSQPNSTCWFNLFLLELTLHALLLFTHALQMHSHTRALCQGMHTGPCWQPSWLSHSNA